ncbi:MAG: glycosyltransferase family protein [Magnetococcales bacterium]|nr:glycosyltransferase family protein [Magnetococcales bacterium]
MNPSLRDAEVLQQLQAAMAAYRCDEDERAWQHGQRAMQLDPNRVESWTLLGMLHRKAGRIPEAIAAYQQAITLQPFFADTYNNLGNLLLREQNQVDEAVACYRQVVQLRPDSVDALYNLGAALREGGQVEEAVACFDRVIALQPDHVDGHWSLALALLLMGNYRRGWPEYEWRWRLAEVTPRLFRMPQWDGSALDGRTILVHAEQGLGDTLQFIRYVPWVADRGGRVMLEVGDPLARLLQRFPGVAHLVPQRGPWPDFDCHVPLLSLPGLFATESTTIPDRIPYLAVDAPIVAHWSRRLRRQRQSVVRVGLVWGGNPNVKNDRWRSPRLRPLLDLFTVTGVDFYLLQHGDGRRDLESLSLPDHVIDIAAEVKDMADTAAIMAQLDLVISSDTATAHLAGALGLPAWILLPFAPDWRWMLGRRDTPWYPTLKLFRQARMGCWRGVVSEVKQELQQLITEIMRQ